MEQLKGTVNAYGDILNLTQKSGVSVEYLEENLISFASVGSSLMLGPKSRLEKPFTNDFSNVTLWYSAVEEISGLLHLRIFCDKYIVFAISQVSNKYV